MGLWRLQAEARRQGTGLAAAGRVVSLESFRR